jgi:hypothetical protein
VWVLLAGRESQNPFKGYPAGSQTLLEQKSLFHSVIKEQQKVSQWDEMQLNPERRDG